MAEAAVTASTGASPFRPEEPSTTGGASMASPLRDGICVAAAALPHGAQTISSAWQQ